MGSNELCGLNTDGDGTYTTDSVTKLCKGLRGSAITSLGCAAAPWRPLSCWALLAPTLSPTLAHSLRDNQFCGLYYWGRCGTYTTVGITKLCKGLKGSAITSLECAAAP